MRISLHVLGMCVFGSVALLVPGWLYDARVMRPLPAAWQPEPAPTATSGRMIAPTGQEALLSAAFRAAQTNLEFFVRQIHANRRPEAMHALDAAYANSISYWTTPTKNCLDGRGDICKDYAAWVQAWTEIKG